MRFWKYEEYRLFTHTTLDINALRDIFCPEHSGGNSAQAPPGRVTEPSVSGPDKDAPDQQEAGQHRQSHSPGGRFSAAELGKRAKSIGSLGIIPIILAAGPILGILIGKYLDEKFETSPWLAILFIIFGFVASTKQIIKLLKNEEDKGNGKNRHRRHSSSDSGGSEQS